MISGIYGYIGSGKSYHAVSVYILPMLKAGYTVVTNMTGLDGRVIEQIHGIDASKLIVLTDKEVRGFWLKYRCEENPEGEAKVVFVIDEIQNFYGASQWKENKDSRESFKVFLTKNRHYGHTVIWITQTPAMVHPDVVQLTEMFVQCTKIGFIKWVAADKYSYVIRTGYKGKNSTILKQGFGRYNAKIFLCYKSFDSDVEETKTASDTPGWLPWKQISIFGGLILFIIVTRILFYVIVQRKQENEIANNPTHIAATKILHGNDNMGEGISNPKDLIVCDGYFIVDSVAEWLASTQVLAVSRDTTFRSGYIRSNIGIIRIIPASLPIPVDVPESEGMGHTSPGVATGGDAPISSSLRLGDGIKK